VKLCMCNKPLGAVVCNTGLNLAVCNSRALFGGITLITSAYLWLSWLQQLPAVLQLSEALAVDPQENLGNHGSSSRGRVTLR